MKKILVVIIMFLAFAPIVTKATAGGLQKASIKTCPNGITYGKHKDGKGGEHWHIAITNGNNYYASGDAISSDPCPKSNTNKGTAGQTQGGTNSSTTTSNNGRTTNSVVSNQNSSKQTIHNEVKSKSSDKTIKNIFIDGNSIEIQDEMNYETVKRETKVEIELNDARAEYEFENRPLEKGDNLFEIKVIAEDQTTKDYKLIITKKVIAGTATIRKFKLGAGEVEFKDNKATIKILKGEDSLDYDYDLSDYKATLKMYLNEVETTELNGLKENDKIKLVVIDKDENESIYEITVKEASILYTFLVYGLTAVLMLSPIIVIIVVKLNKKKKNQETQSI